MHTPQSIEHWLHVTQALHGRSTTNGGARTALHYPFRNLFARTLEQTLSVLERGMEDNDGWRMA